MNPIDAVKERLDHGRLWQQGEFGDYDMPGQRVCLVGACYAVALATHTVPADLVPPLHKVIGEQYPDRAIDLDGDCEIPLFNDHPDTTWLDIERVLDKASALWDEASA